MIQTARILVGAIGILIATITHFSASRNLHGKEMNPPRNACSIEEQIASQVELDSISTVTIKKDETDEDDWASGNHLVIFALKSAGIEDFDIKSQSLGEFFKQLQEAANKTLVDPESGAITFDLVKAFEGETITLHCQGAMAYDILIFVGKIKNLKYTLKDNWTISVSSLIEE